MNPRSSQTTGAFTLVELSIASSITTLLAVGMFMGVILLQKSFRACQHHATSQIQQLRLLDYMSLDLRRAVDVHKRADGGFDALIPDFYQAQSGGTSRNIPGHFDLNDTVREPQRNDDRVQYGGAPITVSYYKQGTKVYRRYNGL